VVSRQRAWGIPITVFYCAACKKPLPRKETIEQVARSFEARGADVWFSEDPEQLLPKELRVLTAEAKAFTRRWISWTSG